MIYYNCSQIRYFLLIFGAFDMQSELNRPLTRDLIQ
jgi:hypothetical protein